MDNELVSIIIRTSGRPEVLRNALESVRGQTYPCIQVVVAEDGENVSENFIKDNFSDLNVVYCCSGKRQGRSVTGNIGLKLADGKYLNFLDDDDLFLSEHVATLVAEMKQAHCLIAYSIAEEHQITLGKSTNYNLVRRKFIRYNQPYSRLLLLRYNYIPIQCVMFDRILYERMGGFDPGLDVLEDWDLWVRYSLCCDFRYVPKVTSIYHTPYKGYGKESRQKILEEARAELLKKYENYELSMTVAQVGRDLNYVLELYGKRKLRYYVHKIRDYVLYHDI